jgi:hypothetical protein
MVKKGISRSIKNPAIKTREKNYTADKRDEEAISCTSTANSDQKGYEPNPHQPIQFIHWKGRNEQNPG